MDVTYPRLCPTCTFFDLLEGSPGYSSYTPGESGYFRCAKGKWTLNPDCDSLADARKALHMAETCADYELYTEDA